MNITREIIDTVKRSVTAIEVAQALGLTVTRANRCQCLWHSDKNPSLKLYDGARGCWCYSCQHGGSVIDMVQQYYGYSMPDAVRWLNDTFRLGLDLDRPIDKGAVERARKAAEEHAKRNAEIDEERLLQFDLMVDANKTADEAEDRIKRIAPNDDTWYDEDELYRLLRIREDMRIIAEEARKRYEALSERRYEHWTSTK